MSHYPKFDAENPTATSSKFLHRNYSVKPLAARILTMVTLVVSLIIMKTNRFKFSSNDHLELTGDFSIIARTYNYVFYIMVVAFMYTVVQIPLAIKYIKVHLATHELFSYIEFYADKVSGFMLATATGAMFGVTLELKKRDDDYYDGSDQAKFDTFYNVCYISAGFLLIAFVGSAFSSIKSSLALSS